MTPQEARARWAKDSVVFAQAGASFPDVISYRAPEWAQDINRVPGRLLGMASDSVMAAATAPNGGIPAFLTMTVDPEVFPILFSPTDMAEIWGEGRRGDWTTQTAMFPTVEHAGEVSSYGDRNDNGTTDVNPIFPQRQSYLFQTVKSYGELQLARAGEAKINLANEIDQAAADAMNRFLNWTYAVGVAGLQCYGGLNDPALPAALTPVTKAAGNGNVWMYNGAVNASANEVYQDIQQLYAALVSQTGGIVKMKDPMTLALSPTSSVALTATNSFNVNVAKLLADNFPNIKVKTEVRYDTASASNPQGVTGGAVVQLIADKLQGRPTGFAAFNEKGRQGPVVPGLSSWQQKLVGGTWGTVIRQPAGVATLKGV